MFELRIIGLMSVCDTFDMIHLYSVSPKHFYNAFSYSLREYLLYECEAECFCEGII